MSYRDGLYRAKPKGHAHPMDRGFATAAAAWQWAKVWSRVFGSVWVERDGQTLGHVTTPLSAHGDGTAYRGE
jgi:hypothetical protein